MSNLYILYSIETGEIHRASSSIIENSNPNLDVIVKDVSDFGSLKYMNVIGNSLVFADKGLELCKKEKWNEIKNQRDKTEFSGFTYNSNVYDSDAISQSRIQGAVQLAQLAISTNQEFLIEWTLADNTTVELDANQMLQVGIALSEHIGLQHSKARNLRKQIELASTKAELDQITW